MNTYTDNRVHQRRQIDQLLSLERWQPGFEGEANEVLEVQGLDISSGGLGLVTLRPLRVGEVLKAEISLNGNGVRLPVYSEVVWILGDGEWTRVGLKFLS